MDSFLLVRPPVKDFPLPVVSSGAAFVFSLATGCVHNDWPPPKTSMAPNQLVTNEENLFDASGGERSACNARLVRVDFGDTCLRCGAIDVSLDGTRLGRAAAPKAPPTASHAWVRPQTHARAHAAIPSLAVSVEPNAAHRVDVAPAATPCTLTVPASGGASIEIAPGCETQAVEVRCAGF